MCQDENVVAMKVNGMRNSEGHLNHCIVEVQSMDVRKV
jgi:hypothetical protein